MYYTEKRHESGGNPKSKEDRYEFHDWRMRDRLKTVCAALAVCLNIGVDPPDVVRTNPTSTMECWTDTSNPATPSQKIMEKICGKLQQQYEQLSMRIRYKQYQDPSVEETRKFCMGLRKSARNERVLFHFNGHGVPLPTPSGEIWVFNRGYTQYIPVSIFDLQAWLQSPSLYVYDCSQAGNIVNNFNRFIKQHQEENEAKLRENPDEPVPSYDDNLQLAACRRDEFLPTAPELPADVFTSCLTTPIEISLRFYILQNQLPSNLNLKDVFRTPGRYGERRTPLGELNWIFTAVTDTIAWNVFPAHLFKKLFRQDLMVAALFRNFLLAQRIMGAYNCHPMSVPELPDTTTHPIWDSWDLAMDGVISQLPAILAGEEGGPPYEYQNSNFFSEQLTAFDVYLSKGATQQDPPSQLPIVLQVLLSQVHRLRALILLSRFLDLGPWAVNLSLTIGIFPYVLKLLQSPALELRSVMVFIWARILAVDPSCQIDLIRDNGYQYFFTVLKPEFTFGDVIKDNDSEHRAMSAFVLAVFCKDFRQGQAVCLNHDIFQSFLHHIAHSDNLLLRQWCCLCLSTLWEGFSEAKWLGIREQAPQALCDVALDPVPEVRAAALHALNNFLGIEDLTRQVAQIEESIAANLMIMTGDGNSMVRKELLVFCSTFVKRYRQKFLVTAYEQLLDEREKLKNPDDTPPLDRASFIRHRRSDSQSSTHIIHANSRNSIQGIMWMHLLLMTIDPHPEVARDATYIVDYVHNALLESPAIGHYATDLVLDIARLFRQQPAPASRQSSIAPQPRTSQSPAPAGPPALPRNESYLSAGIRRTASVAAALKHLTLGGSQQDSGSQRNQIPNGTGPRRGVPNSPRSKLPVEWSQPPGEHDTTPTSSLYQPAKKPKPRGFTKRDVKEKLQLPLQSGFLQWCIEYFREPQMAANEMDEPGSNDYNCRLWRRTRNDNIMNTTQPLKARAGSSRWDVSAGFFNSGGQPSKLCFHQFEDHLAIADDRDGISIWDWAHLHRLTRFSFGNPTPSSRITDLRFINEDDLALLLAGSSDGTVKIFRSYDRKVLDPEPPSSPTERIAPKIIRDGSRRGKIDTEGRGVEVVSAWKALTDLVPSTRNAGMVTDWQQSQGRLLVAGDVKVIKVWNAATEICTLEVPARSSSPLTSLTSDQVAGNILVGGYGDGALRVFDLRLKPQLAMTRCWRHHKQWITGVHMQRGGLRELVSGSREGVVRLWDIRMEGPIREVPAAGSGAHQSSQGGGVMRTLSVHEHAPVFCT